MREKNRVLVLIDGFNYYHKLKNYQKEFQTCVKWLNYKEMVESALIEYDDFQLEIIYFSAIADQHTKHSVERHQQYIRALKKTGVEIVLGEFKGKSMPCCPKKQCRGCNSLGLGQVRQEEKNTDVNIAIKLLEYAIFDKFDDCYLLSEDNDFVSVVKRVKELYPDKRIIICPPPQTNYKVDDLVKASREGYFYRFRWNKVKRFQFQDDFEGLKNPWKI